jgi:hypothetical protein
MGMFLSLHLSYPTARRAGKGIQACFQGGPWIPFPSAAPRLRPGMTGVGLASASSRARRSAQRCGADPRARTSTVVALDPRSPLGFRRDDGRSGRQREAA